MNIKVDPLDIYNASHQAGEGTDSENKEPVTQQGKATAVANGKATAKAPSTSKQMPKLSLKDTAFVSAYINSGFNGKAAYKATRARSLDVKDSVAYSGASEHLRKPHIREAILMAMRANGVDESAVSKRIRDQLDHTDSWTVNEGIKHSIDILGLKAPTESHHTVDKRSINVNVSSEDAKLLLKDMITKSRG